MCSPFYPCLCTVQVNFLKRFICFLFILVDHAKTSQNTDTYILTSSSFLNCFQTVSVIILSHDQYSMLSLSSYFIKDIWKIVSSTIFITLKAVVWGLFLDLYSITIIWRLWRCSFGSSSILNASQLTHTYLYGIPFSASANLAHSKHYGLDIVPLMNAQSMAWWRPKNIQFGLGKSSFWEISNWRCSVVEGSCIKC